MEIQCLTVAETVATVKRQSINSLLASKKRIIEQTGQIMNGMLETIQKQTLALGTSAGNYAADDVKALPNAERLALAEKTE